MKSRIWWDTWVQHIASYLLTNTPLSWTKAQMVHVVMMQPVWRWLLLGGSWAVVQPQSQHSNQAEKLGVVSIMMQLLGWYVPWTTTGPTHSTRARHVCIYCHYTNWCHLSYSHRANICNFHPEYLVTADCWPRFLYKDEKYDPNNPIKGLFKNKMLVRVRYHHSFCGIILDWRSCRRLSTFSPHQVRPIPRMWSMTLTRKMKRSHLRNVEGAQVRNAAELTSPLWSGWNPSVLVWSHIQQYK